jgi:hypothetical protein
MSDNRISISEKDKPFILALVASGITILSIVFAAVGALVGNKDMTTESIEVMKYTFTLTTTAWAFYFGKSGNQR